MGLYLDTHNNSFVPFTTMSRALGLNTQSGSIYADDLLRHVHKWMSNIESIQMDEIINRMRQMDGAFGHDEVGERTFLYVNALTIARDCILALNDSERNNVPMFHWG